MHTAAGQMNHSSHETLGTAAPRPDEGVVANPANVFGQLHDMESLKCGPSFNRGFINMAVEGMWAVMWNFWTIEYLKSFFSKQCFPSHW